MLNAFDLHDPPFVAELFPELMNRGESTIERLGKDLRLTGHSANDVKSWITGIISTYGITSTEWARMSDLAPSTLNRFLSPNSPVVNLSATTIDNLSRGIRKILLEKNLDSVVDRQYFNVGGRRYRTVEANIIGSVSPFSDGYNPIIQKNVSVRFTMPVLAGLSEGPFGIFTTAARFGNIYESGAQILCTPVYKDMRKIFAGGQYIFHKKSNNGKIHGTIYNLRKDPEGEYWFLPIVKRTADDPGLFLGNRFNKENIIQDGKATFLIVGSCSPEPGFLRELDLRARDKYEREEDALRAEEEEQDQEAQRRAAEEEDDSEATNDALKEP